MTATSGDEPAGSAPLSELPPAEFHNPLELKLDPYNPRLRQEEEGLEQTDLLKVMVDRFEIEELGVSMVSSGYLAYDPMIGVRERGTVTILEGNRRLAALQLLLDPARTPNRRHTRWQQLSSQLTKDSLDRLRRIPVHVFESRDDPRIQAYVGFRHVTGVLPWPALEKAGYIGHLIEQVGWSYSQVGERLGNRATTVERHYVAYRLVEQARELQIDGAESMRNSFGVLI